MNDQGAFIANLLDASAKAFAAGTVLRLQESGTEASAFVERLGFGPLVENAQQRLVCLAEALACGRPELFALDVEWVTSAYLGRGLSLELLKAMLACLEEELAENLPSEAARTAADYVRQGAAAVDRQAAVSPVSETEGSKHSEFALRFLRAALEGDRRKAEAVALEALDEGIGFGELHQHVIKPAQAEVGRLWQHGELHVGEEHAGTCIVEHVLAVLRSRLPEPEAVSRSVLVASVSGNLHEVGARIVADHFEHRGWRVIFLGANVPSEDLARAVEDHRPDLVALSAGLTVNVRSTASAVAAVAALESAPKILVGGVPFVRIPELWQDVGADAHAKDAETAVQEGLRLTGS